MRFFLLAVLLTPTLPHFRQDAGMEDKILERGDALLNESKSAYENAREKSAVAGFVEAGFKLEEARIKFVVLQEIGSAEKQKVAIDRLRAINQLAKLIHDGKVAISGSPADSNPTAKAPDAPAAPDPAVPAPAPNPGAPPIDVTKRMAIPDVSKQKEAEKLVRDLFKDQYSKKTPADRRTLAGSLLKEALKSKDDPASLWVLCREAQEVASQVADVNVALEATETTARFFDVDPLTLKTAVLNASGKSAKTPDEFAALTEALLKLLTELIAADQYDVADKTSTFAVSCSKKANDVVLAARTSARAKEVTEAKTLYQSMKSHLQVQAKNPDDPTANLEIGIFLCYVKGSWDLGLRFIAKGSDATLKGLAEKELALPTQTAEQIALADGWFDLSEREKSPLRKSQLLAHAKAYYEAALPGAPGLLRSKIEKRLATLPQGPAIPFPTVDLLRIIDLKRDVVQGDWTLDGKELLLTKILHGSRVAIPYETPDEYELTIIAARKEGNAPLFIILSHGTTQWMVGIDDWGGTVTSMGNIDGKNMKEAETAVPGHLLTNDKPATIVCSVRRAEVSLTIDGKKIFTYKAGYERLTNQPNLALQNHRLLGIGCGNCRFSITKLALTTISGQGKVVR
jgi:hypothetical protein